MKYLFDYIRKNFVYALVAATIIFVMVSYIYTQTHRQPVTQPPLPIQTYIPTPTGFGAQISPALKEIARPIPGENNQIVSTSDQERLRRDSLIGQLIARLPYFSTNFSFEYNYSTNQFTLSLKAGQEDMGNKEFDAFLQTNQINDRSWLNNLIIKTQ